MTPDEFSKICVEYSNAPDDQSWGERHPIFQLAKENDDLKRRCDSNSLLSLHGWGLRRHVKGEIVVTHRDGSGVVIRENSDRISESLFFRMMDDFLTAKPN